MAETYFRAKRTIDPGAGGKLQGYAYFRRLVAGTGGTFDADFGDGLIGVLGEPVEKGQIVNGVLLAMDGTEGVPLLANTADLEVDGALYYRATFAVDYIDLDGKKQHYPLKAIDFLASTDTTEVNLQDFEEVVGAQAVGQLRGERGFPVDAVVLDGTEMVSSVQGDEVGRFDLTPLLQGVIDGAPGALDTLNELAAALGDDANFATTVTNSLATKAALLVPTAVKTAAYAAAVRDLIPADATAGGFTITLPAAPTDGSVVVVKKIDNTANVVTVQRGGTDVFNQTGGATTLQITIPDQTVALQYQAGIWYVTGHGLPLAALDSRFDSRYTPLHAPYILGPDGDIVLYLQQDTDAVNYLQVKSKAAGQSRIELEAVGVDTDLSIWARLKGPNSQFRVYSPNDLAIIRGSGPGTNVTTSVEVTGTAVLRLGRSATLLNYAEVLGSAAAGGKISFRAAGTDTNLDIDLVPKGTGSVKANGVAVATKLSATATLDFGAVAAQSFADLTITVTGAAEGDAVALGVPTAAVSAGIAYTAWVSASNTVTVRAHNYTAGAVDPASGTFKATIIR